MSNSTNRGAQAVHGSNPQFLVEKVIRARIYDSLYWKEHCFALNAESLIDQAIACNAIGGVYDRQTPTPFMCLTLKLLQLQPEKEILFEYLLAEEFKYLRALAAFYIRLTFRSLEVYEILEPLMKDYRKLRVRQVGGYSLTHFDEFIDDLLTQERVCDIILPRLTQRSVLEETEGLPPRKSLLVRNALSPQAMRCVSSLRAGRRYSPPRKVSLPYTLAHPTFVSRLIARLAPTRRPIPLSLVIHQLGRQICLSLPLSLRQPCRFPRRGRGYAGSLCQSFA
ncbi:PRP38 family-domain-containing protein [Papiliotrema laurentii]|uniref:Pre-mRNA-splicing factor 38 n=1 Tax=Papiliotrema laurentii TaxID=5418 RepID=A0AAD9FSQ2_PAPLA|nr:PRP38 family-domain-containing protein [Papiliotrema laurentii]